MEEASQASDAAACDNTHLLKKPKKKRAPEGARLI